MSMDIDEMLGLVIEPPKLTLEFADSSTKSPQGTIKDLSVQIGNCSVPTDFQVVEMSNGASRPLILRRPFLATVGAVTYMPNKRISFANIDKNVYYRDVPTNKCTRLASSISVLDKRTHVHVSQEHFEDKGKVKEVLNESNRTMHKRFDAQAKKKLKCKEIKGDPHLMLIPYNCSDGMIKYEVKCKGTSKSFSKVRAVLTSEMKEKRMDAVNGFMSKVLKLKMFDGGTCFGASSHAHLH